MMGVERLLELLDIGAIETSVSRGVSKRGVLAQTGNVSHGR